MIGSFYLKRSFCPFLYHSTTSQLSNSHQKHQGFALKPTRGLLAPVPPRQGTSSLHPKLSKRKCAKKNNGTTRFSGSEGKKNSNIKSFGQVLSSGDPASHPPHLGKKAGKKRLKRRNRSRMSNNQSEYNSHYSTKVVDVNHNKQSAP